MRAQRALNALLFTVLAGCYHVTVDTGKPADTTKINRPWATSFLWGAIPPKVITTAVTCQGGVSRVETRHSFLNMIAAVGTLGIYTPVDIRVVCAPAP